MRRYFKGVGFQIFMWIAAVSMVIVWVPGIYRRSGRGGHEGWVAEVNGVPIAAPDFRRAVMNHEAQLQFMRAQYGEYADLFIRSLGANAANVAFDSLVRHELLNGIVRNCNFSVHPDFAIDMLSNPRFVRQWLGDIISTIDLDRSGGLTRQTLQAQLHRAGLSAEEFEHRLYSALSRAQLVELVAGTEYLPQYALKAECEKRFASKRFDIMSCSLDRFYDQEKKKAISAQELKAFYDRQTRTSKKYWTPEKRVATVWTFDQKSFDTAVGDADLERYYSEHQGSFVAQPTQVQVRRILFKIDKTKPDTHAVAYKKAQEVLQSLLQHPDTFAQKAREVSQDAESAKNGGLLPFFAKGSRDQAFERTALLLKKDGDISEVFETADGIEIIQRVGRKQPVYKQLAAVRADIERILRDEKFNQVFRQEADALFATGIFDAEKLREMVTRYGGVQSTVELTKGADSSRLAQAVFAMPEGETTHFMDGKKGIVVQLQTVVARQAPDLNTIKQTVEDDLRKDRARQAMITFVRDLKTKVRKGNAQALAKENGCSYERTNTIKPDDNAYVETLKKRGIPVQLFAALDKVPGVAVSEGDKVCYVIVLDEIEPVSAELFIQKENTIASSLSAELADATINGFVASLYRNATIKTNETLLHAEEDYPV